MRLTTLFGLFALTSPATAQVVATMCVNGAVTAPTEYHVTDTNTAVSSQFLNGWLPAGGDPQIAGAAADEGNGILYMSNNPTSPTGQTFIYAWPYNSPSDPVLVVTDPADVNGAGVDCSGLAFGNGTLYALNQFGGTTDGIYSIDLITGLATLEFAFTGGVDVGGFDFNSSDGRFYCTSDAAAARGIYVVDLALQSQTLVATYPAGVTDVDGCAVDPTGPGVVYLIEDNPAPLHAFDIGTGSYLPALTSPVTGTYIYSGGAWAPGMLGLSTVGVPFCDPNNMNSTGLSTNILGLFGAPGGSGLHLEVTQGPVGEFGYFLVGTAFSEPGAMLSDGRLCLLLTGGNQVGRYNITGTTWNSVGQFDASGIMQNIAGTSTLGSGYDVPANIPLMGAPPILSGSTWHFQFWHRDTASGMGRANFSNGLSVTF